MNKKQALKNLNDAMRTYKAMPSAMHFRMLTRAMLAYQEAELGA